MEWLGVVQVVGLEVDLKVVGDWGTGISCKSEGVENGGQVVVRGWFVVDGWWWGWRW